MWNRKKLPLSDRVSTDNLEKKIFLGRNIERFPFENKKRRLRCPLSKHLFNRVKNTQNKGEGGREKGLDKKHLHSQLI